VLNEESRKLKEKLATKRQRSTSREKPQYRLKSEDQILGIARGKMATNNGHVQSSSSNQNAEAPLTSVNEQRQHVHQ